MAGFNPFREFRKYQKEALMVVGVGAMLSFIIIPSCMQMMSGPGSRQELENIAECRRYGNINSHSLSNLHQNHNYLGRFYKALYRNLIGPTGENQAQLAMLGMVASQYEQRDEEAMVDDWLLSRYAVDQGITVTKKMIVSYLNQLTGNMMTDQAFSLALNEAGIDEATLEYLLKDKIAVDQVRIMFEMFQMSVPPSTRWEWFQRLHRQITVEVTAVNVDDFVSKTTEPSTSQLLDLFNKNKKTVYNPSSPNPGFTIPNQHAFQYAKAVPSQKTLDSIPKEEVEKYYEANKHEMFRKKVEPLIQQQQRSSLPGLDPGNIFRPNRNLPFPTPTSKPAAPSENKVQLTEEISGEQPKTEAAPKTEEQPKAEAAPKTEEQPKAEEKKESSSIIRKPVTRLVSFRTENEEPKPVENKPAEQPKADETKPAENKPAEQPKADEAKPVENKPAEQPKADEAKQAENKPAESKPVEQPKTEEPKPETVVDLSILFKPLSEVEGQIRQILAQQKVDQSIAAIEEKMRDYFQAYNRERDLEKDAPPVPDMAAFAAEQGLEWVSVPLGNIYDAFKSEFARGNKERQFLASYFTETPILFDPKIIEGDSVRYLFWTNAFVQQHEPKNLDEIKETVLKTWKEIHARPLAMKRAEELAEEAKKSGKTLAETFASQAGMKIVETEPFTWKSYGASMLAEYFAMQGIPPRLGEIREKGVAAGDSELDNKLIVAPGEKFMEVAYGLPVGGIGAVMNQPETVVYIIRVINSSPAEEALWQQFQSTSFAAYRLAGLPEAAQDARNAWMDKIRAEVGFKWIQKPEQRQRRR